VTSGATPDGFAMYVEVLLSHTNQDSTQGMNRSCTFFHHRVAPNLMAEAECTFQSQAWNCLREMPFPS
jgi:hypothetical protein